jgi:hypothetical protein
MGTSKPRTVGSEPGMSVSRVSRKGPKSSRSRDLKFEDSPLGDPGKVGEPEADRYPGRASLQGRARECPQGKQSGTA